jgi:predicted molibdopterin-dependent oxidoreductase YjgC
LSSKWQGNTIDLCPVGALTSRVFRFEARVWELTNTPSVCPMCSVGCNILLGVKNNKLRRITPRENMEVNDAWMCDKGRFAHGFVDHPDRLRTPLIRRNGELQPTSWDEALDIVARRFSAIVQEHGPHAIAGLGSARVTNEAGYLFQRFMRTVIGTNNVDYWGRMPADARPLTSLPDLEGRDVILLAGCDPSTEAPLVELWIKKAVLRHGANVLIANPRQIELGRYGGPWLGYRPGSEVSLIHGIARAILDAGGESRATRVTNMEDLRSWLKAFSPEQVERISGVPAVAIRQAAAMLARAKHPAILCGPGWMWNRRERANLAALGNLALLLGGIEVSFVAQANNTVGALAMGLVPDLYPGQQPFKDDVRSHLASVWGGKLPSLRGLGFDGMMAAGQEGSLKGMWIIGADPAYDCRIASDVLGRVPFLVVQELFMTDTASLAEVVLPAASFAETDGSFTNLAGRLQVIQAAMRPPGQARPDWLIIAKLARHMVDSKRQKAWDFSSATDVLSEIARTIPGYRGVSYAAIGQAGWQAPAPQPAVRRAFVRVEPAPEGLEPSGLSAMAVGTKPAPDDLDAGYPLTLLAGRLLYDRGTLLRRSGRIQNLVPAAFVLIHPLDADALGLANGDEVTLVSATGRLRFTVAVSHEVVPGVVFAPFNLSDAPLSVLLADHRTLAGVRMVK